MSLIWRRGRGAALALTLLALGCSKPLATIDPSARPSALSSAEAELSRSRASRVVAIARQHVGTRYAWGGASPSGFDCSGFVMYVYARVGVGLPHNAAQQYRYGRSVPRERLEPGDIVFFDDLQHNGIYIGGGRFIHARRSGGTVMVSGLDESWYRARWIGAKRL